MITSTNRSIRLLGVAILALVLVACSRVPAGNVGILFNSYGSDKGVEQQTLPPGRYWLTPNEEIYVYPTFTQNVTWQSPAPGSTEPDESISFQSREGMVVSGNVGMSYALDPARIPLVFQKYRKGIDEITDVYLRNHVRDALVAIASDLPVEEIYGPKRNEVMEEATRRVRAAVDPIGIKVEKLYWIGALRLPGEIQNAINAKLRATQMAQQRENEVAQAKAEADKEIAKARGESESKLLLAKAEAEAIQIRGAALRENQKLVDLTLAEKWDGKLPVNMYGGGAVPFINVNSK